MTRVCKEWRSDNHDAMPPPRVRLRILLAHDRKCHWTGREIRPQDKWHLDHVRALIEGGENCESNLAPILAEAHKEKTREEMVRKKKDARVAKKAAGIRKAPGALAGRSHDDREADRAAKVKPGKLPVPARRKDIFGNPL